MKEQPFWRRYARLWGADREADIRDELDFHLAMRAEEEAAKGAGVHAFDAARRAFGDEARIADELRRMGQRREVRERRVRAWQGMGRDLMQSLRTFRRAPGVPLLIACTLGLGIGGTTTVFTLFDAVVLRPVAVPDVERVFALSGVQPNGNAGLGVSYPMFKSLREATTSWEFGALIQRELALRAGEHSDRVPASVVSGNYFEVLNVVAQRGRLLQTSDEAAPGASPYVVISDALWRGVFGARDDIVGSTVQLNGHPFEVIGVAPRGFRGTDVTSTSELWLPMSMLQTIGNGGLLSNEQILTTDFFTFFDLLGRVRPGVAVEQASAEADGLYRRFSQEVQPTRAGSEGPVATPTLQAIPIREAATGRSREDLLRFMRLLWVVSALCLTIGCVNVANLQLLTATRRSRELSVRLAIGAPRIRIFRQMLLESLVQGLAGAVTGIAFGLLGVALLTRFTLPGEIAVGGLDLQMSGRMLAFALALSIGTAVAFGLAPALAVSRPRLLDALAGIRTGSSLATRRVQSTLVAMQVALSIVLVVGAFLFTRSMRAALEVDLGFRDDGIAALSFSLRAFGLDEAAGAAFLATTLERTRGQEGLDAALTTHVPPGPASIMPITPVGADPTRARGAALAAVTPGYHELLGLDIVEGRRFTEADGPGAPLVVIVSESAARKFWPDRSALGEQITLFRGLDQHFTVVGVMRDASLVSIGASEPFVMLSLLQNPGLFAMERSSLIARGPGGAAATLSQLRSILREANPQLPVFDGRSIEDQVDRLLVIQRFGMTLLTLFAIIACVISAVGIYSVTAYEVAQRRYELGVRAALGADLRQLGAAIFGRTGLAIAAGTVLGLVLAALFTGGLRRFLFGIAPHEPVSYALAALTFAIIAVAATWAPLRRARAADPMEVLRP